MRSYFYKVACLLLMMHADGGYIAAQFSTDMSILNSTGYELTLNAPNVAQQVDPEIVSPQAMKFVQIEVTDVINQSRIPLGFTVYYRPVRGDQLLLGMFSLFPPDNPGKFLVATQGKLQIGGTILVSLAPLEKAQGQGDIRVHLKRFSFIRE